MRWNIAHRLQLIDQVVKGVGDGADEGMLAAREAQQLGQFQVAEAVDLLEQLFIRHEHCRDRGRLPSGTLLSAWSS